MGSQVKRNLQLSAHKQFKEHSKEIIVVQKDQIIEKQSSKKILVFYFLELGVECFMASFRYSSCPLGAEIYLLHFS